MKKQTLNEQVEKIVNFIKFLNLDLKPKLRFICNNHIGATIADAVLQSGMNYRTVVKPRVIRILRNYSSYKTISDILNLIEEIGTSELLNWKGQEKIERFNKIIILLHNCRVETEEDLKIWINNEINQQMLLNIKGIGPKTVDYIKLLVGIPSIPIDRHLLKFANLCEVRINKYFEASLIYKRVSETLNVEYHVLDSAIWNFMSSLSIRY